MSYYNWSFSWWEISVEDVHLESGAIVTITILAGLCVIAEGLLIRRMAMKVTTPCIEANIMTIYSNGLSKKRPIAVTISINISLTIRTPAISFLNTMNLLYQRTIVIIFAIILGYRRVKQERKYFNRRIIWGWTELIGQWKDGWLYALIISVISIGAGLTVKWK